MRQSTRSTKANKYRAILQALSVGKRAPYGRRKQGADSTIEPNQDMSIMEEDEFQAEANIIINNAPNTYVPPSEDDQSSQISFSPSQESNSPGYVSMDEEDQLPLLVPRLAVHQIIASYSCAGPHAKNIVFGLMKDEVYGTHTTYPCLLSGVPNDMLTSFELHSPASQREIVEGLTELIESPSISMGVFPLNFEHLHVNQRERLLSYMSELQATREPRPLTNLYPASLLFLRLKMAFESYTPSEQSTVIDVIKMMNEKKKVVIEIE